MGIIRAAIVGGSGYSGAELLRLLARRSDVRVEHVTAASSAGQRVDALYPAFSGVVDLVYEEFSPDALHGMDVIFVALPSGEAMRVVPALRESGARIIDLGGDFRLQDAARYEQYYKRQHTAQALLPEAVYGLPELHREAIAKARLVANPGCYPTSVLLGLLPAVCGGLVRTDGITVTSLSGVSGAGRSAAVELSFAEMHDNVRAYRLGHHQHVPEIESVLAGVAGKDVALSFVPHLIPLTRGIYTTIHAQLAAGAAGQDLVHAYESYYRAAPFVRMLRRIPELRGVVGTNYCDVQLTVEPRTGQLIVLTAIDNLVKGAAGQALQNMNIMLGLDERLGLLSA